MKIKTSNALGLIFFGLLVVFVSLVKYSDYDLWWHLKLGESILKSGIPYTDTFSYTFYGKPQYAGEWLADLVIFLSFRFGGFIGIAAIKTGILLLTFFFLVLTLKNSAGDKDTWIHSAIITLTVVLLSMRFRLFVRPYIFSFLFIALFLFILSSYEKNKKKGILFVLPLTEVIWANMSVSAILGPALFLFFFIGNFRSSKDNFTLLAIFTGIAAASLLNPENYGIYSFTLKLFSDPNKSIIGEYQPLSAQILWGYGIKYTFAYQALVIGSAIYFLFMRGWKNVYHVLIFTFFFVQSLLQVRMIEFFSPAAAVFFNRPVNKFLNIIFSRFAGKKAILNMAIPVLVLSLIPLTVLGGSIYKFGIGLKENVFPEKALSFLEQEKIEGKMFNSYGFGGYILWRAPERKVFFDGRNKRLYDIEFDNAYTQIMKDADAWGKAERTWGFTYAVLEYSQRSRDFPVHLSDNPSWALVFWDIRSAVYLKRTPENAMTISSYEYKITKPSFNNFSYLERYLHNPGAIPDIIGQINREIAMNPSNQEPRLAKVFFLYNLGKPHHNEALKELSSTIELEPDLAMEHSALAYLLLEKGLVEKAREETNKALKINPADDGARQLIKILQKQ